MRAILVTLSGIALAAAAQRPAGFTYDPQPRWAEDPETEQVCEVIAKECAGFLRDGSFEGNWAYAELYNADGYLVGLRQVKSTGCRPLDEHMMLGQRHFATVFSKDGPDLDDVTVETAPGVSRDGVRLVKQGETSLSFGC